MDLLGTMSWANVWRPLLTSLPKKVPVDVLTVESMLFPVSLSTTVDFTIFGLACGHQPGYQARGWAEEHP